MYYLGDEALIGDSTGENGTESSDDFPKGILHQIETAEDWAALMNSARREWIRVSFEIDLIKI